MYIMYMSEDSHHGPQQNVPQPESMSVAEARERFPSILEAAEGGMETVIARRGKPIALLGPLSLRRARRPISIDSLIGSGSGLWGSTASGWVQAQREEWD